MSPHSIPHLALKDDEQLVSYESVPFPLDSCGIGLDLLVDLMTKSGTEMPLASCALDGTKGEGLFEAEFGRDALVMADFVGDVMPGLTEITIRRLATLQGVTDRTENGRFSDAEEIGKIAHEMREETDPLAIAYSKKFGWTWPYYGSIDATPMFISACTRAAARNPHFLAEVVVQRDGVERTISQCAQRAVEWLQRTLARSPLGLLEVSAAALIT